MGNSATRNRKNNIPRVQTKGESISDILTARTGRQDFSTAQTLKGDIPPAEDISEAQLPVEDIIIKCNLEEMTKSFFQDYVIVWHDPNINSQENQQYFIQLKRFCDVFTFTEWQKARDFIQSTHAACHVVTSGTNGELIVKEIGQLQSVAKIYIFCRSKDYHSNWAKNYNNKISCIESNIEPVLSQIQSNLLEWYKRASSLKLNLPAFASIFNDSDKSQMNNLHRFLKVIPNFQNRLQAKNDFVNLSKAIYSDPHNTQLISDFEQNYNEYDKEQTLRWYSQESFLYKVTNNCLRIATSDSIQYCRLLLKDLEYSIREQYQTRSKNFNGLLYRGAYLSQEEWLNLKANLNREIEMHGFLSVSKLKNIGLNFMKTDPSKKALITIIVPKGPNEEEQGFAEMEEFSEYPQEKEILFNVRSRFTILETEDDGPYRHLVLLYGAQGFRKFLAEQNPILEVPIPKAERISCYHCKTTPSQMFFLSIFSPQKQIYFCHKCVDHYFAPFLCISPAKEAFTVRMSGCLLTNSHDTDLPFYGYECSKCQAKKQKLYFTCTDCNERSCQSCFENNRINCTSDQHNVILETHPFSFWVQGMSEIEFTHLEFQNHQVLRNNDDLFQQAEMYYESLLYEKAIEYYSTYIQQNEAKGNDSNLADSYQRLGIVFDIQGEYSKALECFFKSIDIQKSVSGECHSMVAASYTSIGIAYNSQGEYKKALEYSLKALDIAKLLFEDGSLEIAYFYMTIGRVYSSQREYKKALEYYLKCLDIRISALGENHPDVAVCSNDIGLVYNDQGEYQKALEYHFKSLHAYKAVYGDNHPEIAITYSHIALIFNYQGEYKKANEYHLKALEVAKFIYGEKHPDLVIHYNNIGHTYSNQGEYNEALGYFFKSLEINKSVSDLATSYQNIGLIYNKQGEYKKALEYYFKSLDITKSICHPTTGTFYNNIGVLYYNQGEDEKALEYYFKALEISKSVNGENHPEIATFYQNIGLVYDHQGEDKKALKYYFKSLDIGKLANGEKHSMVAASYNNIGLSYFKQKEHKKALEYFLKALDSYKAVYGDIHSEIATSYQNIALIYDQQGEYKKALEYFFKCLELQKSLYGDNHPETKYTQEQISGIHINTNNICFGC